MGRNLKGFKIRDSFVSKQPSNTFLGPGMAVAAAYFGSKGATETNFKPKTFCEIIKKEYSMCLEKKNNILCDYLLEIMVANGCIK